MQHPDSDLIRCGVRQTVGPDLRRMRAGMEVRPVEPELEEAAALCVDPDRDVARRVTRLVHGLPRQHVDHAQMVRCHSPRLRGFHDRPARMGPHLHDRTQVHVPVIIVNLLLMLAAVGGLLAIVVGLAGAGVAAVRSPAR